MTLTLGDVCVAIVDCEHKTAPTVEFGIPLIRTTDISRGRLDLAGAKRITESTYREWSRRLPPEPSDIVLAREAPVGDVGWIPPGARVCIGQRTVLLRPDPKRVEPRYLLYLMVSDSVRSEMLSRAEGSTNPHLNMSEIRRLRLPALPTLEEQRAIASVLGALDDKIELNRRMNETLEALARAIFTSWFVDFDPVRAKAVGRQPVGMDAETISLFPDSFEDSPLGPIPLGWPAVRLGTQIDVVRGLSYTGAGLTDAEGGGLPLHNLNSIFEGGGYKHDGLKWYAGEFKDRHLVNPSDVIVANTEQGFDELLIGYPAIVPRRYGDRGLFSADLFRVDMRDGSSLSGRYLRYLLSTPRYHDQIAGYSNGTTINHLPADGLTRPWVALPSARLVERFDALVAPILDRQEQLYAESEALERTRDALLPRLVRGKVRVGV